MTVGTVPRVTDTAHGRVLPDEYVPPRYPVDEPPTYRQRCACGWTGPERYAGVDVGDHARHTAGTP